MPAPVPPGYTRGPILFLGEKQTTIGEVDLLQRFWSEAGAYGARLLLVTTPESAPNLTHLSTLFTGWGIDSLATLILSRRDALFDPGLLAAVETATAVLFAGGDSRSIAPLLGGTPVAQA